MVDGVNVEPLQSEKSHRGIGIEEPLRFSEFSSDLFSVDPLAPFTRLSLVMLPEEWGVPFDTAIGDIVLNGERGSLNGNFACYLVCYRFYGLRSWIGWHEL